MSEEIGLMSLLDNLIVLENGERYLIDEYIERLKKQNKKLNKRIDEAIDILEYYLIGNLKYKDSQKEFEKLLKILKRRR